MASGLAAIFLLAVPLLSACQSVAPPAPVMVQRAQMLMGTLVRISAVAPSEAQAQAAATAGFQEIRRLEELLSTWIPTSELSRVNAAAGREPVAVSPDTLLILQRSLEIAKLTDGGFNIVVGPAIQAWSVTERQRVPSDMELEALRPLLDLAQLRLDRKGSTAFLAKPGMRVDVGGIGKGFAADRAVMVMQRAGATAGVVALSGDIKTFGRLPDGRPFPFGIQHPRKEGALLARLDLQDEAISTAGDYERFFEREGIRYHHILDPKTLKQARGCQSVTIVATEGIMADGLDTGIFVMGPEAGMALIERLPGVEGVIVDREGRVLVSSGLKGRLTMESGSP
ncbi:MAG: FAD:protein FMN transferase [Nitrospirae bacterium]|nr:MAG: FAD:protein FMN transferase [Nitrospirota bacterium]